MEESERIQKQKELIEQIGINNEKEGFQPVAARIMGLLMVSDKEEYTFDEIVEELKISKSTASTALKNLEIRGVLDYITYPGDRKRYFRFISDDPKQILENIKKNLERRINMIDQIIDLKQDKNSRISNFLKNSRKGIKFFIENFDELEKEIEKNE